MNIIVQVEARELGDLPCVWVYYPGVCGYVLLRPPLTPVLGHRQLGKFKVFRYEQV